MVVVRSDEYAAWDEFVNANNLHPSVSPVVAKSWQRCQLRMSPHQQIDLKRLSHENLFAAQVHHFYLLSIARPIMEDIYQFVENSNTAIVIVNPTVYVIGIMGDKSMVEFARQAGISEGVLLSEAEAGTNSFSLSIHNRFPITISGAEHFRQQFHVFADSAAPIFDPTGRLMGALGIINRAGESHPHGLGMVVAGAKAIEMQRQSDLLLNEQNAKLVELNAVLSSVSDGILVWDDNRTLVHVNETATSILGLRAPAMAGRPLEDYIRIPDFILDQASVGKSLTNVDTHLLVGEIPINCLVSLRYGIVGESTRWTILNLRKIEEIRELIQHQTGARISVSIDDFTGDSQQIQKTRRLARKAAPARASVLIRGEAGTGKDYLARALHNASPRREKPFLIFSCSSIPSELVLEELFGLDQGASGNHRSGGRPSKFELANQGTLFFKDIDLLPLEAQTLLLNVLELGIVQRVKSSRPIEVDVRILASSAANLENLVAMGNFRADLFYRISPFEIVLPPLHQRTDDIPFLIDRILSRLSVMHNRTLRLSEDCKALLIQYPWPGNIRELEATLERAAIQAGTSNLITHNHLPDHIRQPTRSLLQRETWQKIPSLESLQREAIIQAARTCNGNVSHMARVLGIGRTTVWRKIKQLNISIENFRERSPH